MVSRKNYNNLRPNTKTILWIIVAFVVLRWLCFSRSYNSFGTSVGKAKGWRKLQDHWKYRNDEWYFLKNKKFPEYDTEYFRQNGIKNNGRWYTDNIIPDLEIQINDPVYYRVQHTDPLTGEVSIKRNVAPENRIHITQKMIQQRMNESKNGDELADVVLRLMKVEKGYHAKRQVLRERQVNAGWKDDPIVTRDKYDPYHSDYDARRKELRKQQGIAGWKDNPLWIR